MHQDQDPIVGGLNFDPARRALLEQLLAAEKLAAGRRSIPRRSQGGPGRLSFAQERLMFLYLLEGPSPTYNVSFAHELAGDLDLSALQAALQNVVDRHEILRTRFAILEGEPRQFVEPGLIVTMLREDLSHLPPESAEPEAQRRAQEVGRQAFDLAQAPLFRFGLWKISGDRWLLLFSLHHIIFDEWSQGVFYRELEMAYRAARNSIDPKIEPPPLQYIDYAEWQVERLKNEQLLKQESYWLEQLTGAPHFLELPTDFARPPVQSFRGGVVRGVIPVDRAETLRRLARDEDTTLYNVMLAAFGTLLYRISGQDDMLIGAPMANRRQPELEELVGLFLNTLAVRLRFNHRPSFRELLRSARAALAQALDNQEVPFEKLVEALHTRRDLSRHPLIQTAFVLHPASLEQPVLDGLELRPVRLDMGQAKFDLTLYLTDGAGGIETRLEYSTDLFTPGTARRVLAMYDALLSSICLNPDQPVVRLALLDEAERERMVTAWNRTRRAYPRERGVVEIFREAAAAHPEALALEYADGHLSYAELDARSERKAVWLRRMGVGREAPVGLRMERSAGMVTAMLAVLKAGGAYLPLDPGYPEERLAYMIADGGVKVIVTRGEWEGPAGVQVVELEAEEAENGAEAPWTEGIDVAGGGERLAYIMYTSGSTGRPKGIEIPQRGIVRLVKNSDYLQVQPGERVGQASTMTFDAATFEVWGALLNGGVLVGLEADVLLSPARLGEALRERRVDHLFLTTALFNQIALAVPDAFAELKTVMFGGEIANPEAARRVLEAEPPERLLHVYGPTESTTFATWHELKRIERGARSLPIGLPISNTTAHVLDGELEPVPIGVPGELYLGGDGLARGYLRRPGLTVERFIPNPFARSDAVQNDPGTVAGGSVMMSDTRIYRTGDRARRLEDGTLEFIDRIDNQIKLRGYRIELEEIEAILSEHPQVLAAAVGLRGAGDAKHLAGYVAAREGFCDGQALRSYLHSRLPEYMIPTRWVFVTDLPVNENGKLDRRQLQAIDIPDDAPSEDYAPPRNEQERLLVHLWEQVLNLGRVGIHDNFFALGGHSLLAVRLFGRIEAETGRRLPLSILFESPTIAGLAAALGRDPTAKDWSALVTINSNGDRPPFYCVHTFGGEALDLSPLSMALGPDQPFFGLQAQGLDGVHPPHESIEELAEYYLEAIQDHQPHGPYYLGGFCFGGVVAYEMACRLHQRGEEAALVAAIDAGAPGHWGAEHRSRFQRIGDFLTNLPNWLHDFSELPASERRVVIRRRLTRVLRRLSQPEANRAGLTPIELIGANNVNLLEAPVHRQKLMEIHMRAIISYRTPRYPGKVTVFRIRRMPLFSTQAPDLGWGRVAAEVDLRLVPGAHHNLLQSPYVETLAEKLRLAIDAAQRVSDGLGGF